MKYTCEECSWHGTEILTAPDPFNEGDVLHACPNCRCISLRPCCDAPGCFEPVTCGTPILAGYRSTCYRHRPPL